jgi:hypothetical protein
MGAIGFYKVKFITVNTVRIQERIAEMAAGRKQYEENYRAFQRSAFTFSTGLKKVSSRLAETAENFYELTGSGPASYRKAC